MVSGLAALRNMANNEDSVNQIVQLGGLELTVGALREHIDNAVSPSNPPLLLADSVGLLVTR